MYQLLASIVRILTSLPPAAIAVGFAAVLITLMGTTYQYVVVQVSLYIVSLSIFSEGYSYDNAVRSAALVFAVIRILSRGGIEPTRMLTNLGAWHRPIAAFLAMTLISSAWSIHRGDTFVSLVGFGIMLIVILSMSDDHDTVLRATQAVIIGSVLISFLFAASSAAWFRGRLHGIYQNANTLGVFALMAAIILYRGWKPRLIPLYLCILAIIIATGSRASGVGAIVGTIAYVVALRRNKVRRSSLSILLVFAAVVMSFIFVASPSASTILRVKDTRTGVWQSALSVGEGKLLQGIGGGAIGLEAGSSVLRIFVELGVIGAVILAFLMFRTVGRYPKAPWQSAMLIGLLGNSMFEAWLFTGGSGIFLVCVLLTRFPERVALPKPTRAVPALA